MDIRLHKKIRKLNLCLIFRKEVIFNCYILLPLSIIITNVSSKESVMEGTINPGGILII